MAFYAVDKYSTIYVLDILKYFFVFYWIHWFYYAQLLYISSSQVKIFVYKYIYRAPLITSESEALGFATRGY